jgi:mannonate dehydratase
MKMTFRWFGKESDPITLSQIKQIPNMTGIMGFLDYKEGGDVWTL